MKHHYLPEFYLKQWAGEDRKLCQYSKVHGNRIFTRRVFPSETGFLNRLYSVDGASEDLEHRVEEDFYSPADSKAAQSMSLLLSGTQKIDLNISQVSSWSRFLLSLMLRMPEDVAMLKKRWRNAMLDVSDDAEADYKARRQPNDPETFREFIHARPNHVFEQEALELLVNLNDSELTGNLLNSMNWHIIDLAKSKFELFLSDRPLFVLRPLGDEDGTLCLPVGPHSLFIASKKSEDINRFLSTKPDSNVRDVNRIVVSQAVKFAYATSDAPLRFMQNNFGKSFDVRAMKGTNNSLLELT